MLNTIGGVYILLFFAFILTFIIFILLTFFITSFILSHFMPKKKIDIKEYIHSYNNQCFKILLIIDELPLETKNNIQNVLNEIKEDQKKYLCQ